VRWEAYREIRRRRSTGVLFLYRRPDMSHDHFIRFEESNFDDLVDKFIKKYQDLWDEFVFDEYANSGQEPDFDHEEAHNERLQA